LDHPSSELDPVEPPSRRAGIAEMPAAPRRIETAGRSFLHETTDATGARSAAAGTDKIFSNKNIHKIRLTLKTWIFSNGNPVGLMEGGFPAS
jgi:hypothetical protein